MANNLLHKEKFIITIFRGIAVIYQSAVKFIIRSSVRRERLEFFFLFFLIQVLLKMADGGGGKKYEVNLN